MERKMTGRVNLENRRNYIDLCKVALANTSGNAAVQTMCVNTLLRPEGGNPSTTLEN